MLKILLHGLLKTFSLCLILALGTLFLVGPALLSIGLENDWWSLLYLPHAFLFLYSNGSS